MDSRCYIDFATGDAAAHAVALSQHHLLLGWLVSNGTSYGLPLSPSALDEVGKETLLSLYEGSTKIILPRSSVDPPPSLVLPRMHILVKTSSAGLTKTCKNFLALLTDGGKLLSKRSPHPPLRYAGTKVHRLDEGFVVQMGDVTRGDGSGGESIYGSSFNDEKEGLKVLFERGTIAMANGGKNTNTSQFFLTLCSDSTRLKKLTGKYVAFGRIDMDDVASVECLEALEKLGDGKGGTKQPIWIEKCGVTE